MPPAYLPTPCAICMPSRVQAVVDDVGAVVAKDCRPVANAVTAMASRGARTRTSPPRPCRRRHRSRAARCAAPGGHCDRAGAGGSRAAAAAALPCSVPSQQALLHHAAVLEDAVGEVVHAGVLHLVVRVLGQDFHAAAVAEVAAVPHAWDGVRGLVVHVVARVVVALLDDLLAGRAARGADLAAPVLELAVVLALLARDADVPECAAVHAEALAAVGALHHRRRGVRRQVHEVAAEDAVHALAEDGAVVEGVEAVVLRLAQHALGDHGLDDGLAAGVMHRAAQREHGGVAQRGEDVAPQVLDADRMLAAELDALGLVVADAALRQGEVVVAYGVRDGRVRRVAHHGLLSLLDHARKVPDLLDVVPVARQSGHDRAAAAEDAQEHPEPRRIVLGRGLPVDGAAHRLRRRARGVARELYNVRRRVAPALEEHQDLAALGAHCLVSDSVLGPAKSASTKPMVLAPSYTVSVLPRSSRVPRPICSTVSVSSALPSKNHEHVTPLSTAGAAVVAWASVRQSMPAADGTVTLRPTCAGTAVAPSMKTGVLSAPLTTPQKEKGFRSPWYTALDSDVFVSSGSRALGQLFSSRCVNAVAASKEMDVTVLSGYNRHDTVAEVPFAVLPPTAPLGDTSV
eukprot:CAMPEP_0118862374 /NCGR_PEP_ID=MMETSP1163-20130328/7597_1 /TAXON_ID=124430 /ORGANISM="Phaeomonas parva, Strain CCMP2877" /LENGTH=628 /DNA_ID=CAMNT_0006796273 /DNA_START=377 /DNA_END=2265 /DNA_ORIENTATION=+